MTKVIANYLPQYHCIPENDLWWGKGYTDWEGVKKSFPLYKGHLQPKVPLNNNYYSLDNIESIKWQANIAKSYGINGFGIYHYWFNDSLHLLDKPVTLLKECEMIDIEYLFIWDNSSWVRSWSNIKFSNDWAPMYEQKQMVDDQGRGILAELIYGNESSWKKHFEYLLPFFLDTRYIKIENKPVFAIYNQNKDDQTLLKMCKYWDNLAHNYGFDGVYIIGKRNNMGISITQHEFLYQPEWSGWQWHNKTQFLANKLYKGIYKYIIKKPKMSNYDKIWKRIIEEAEKSEGEDLCFSGFVNYDDTPRRGNMGRVVKGASPKKFENYIRQLIQISEKKKRLFVFLTAWNEWGEGAYLEPDEDNGYSYLEALKSAVESVNKER